MNENIYLAEKIKVGFNERADTYTGTLGYIIPWDKKKKVWRKLNSWESWREKYMTEEAFEAEKLLDFTRSRERVDKYKLDAAAFIQKNPERPQDKIRERYGDMYNENEQTINNWNKKYKLHTESPEASYKEHNCNDLENYYFRISKKSHNPAVEPKEFDNEPLEGFVLNKKAGGYNTGWNHRQTVCRIYDPRGFEFEITIENLLYILEHTNSIVGKGLEGKFMYGWSDKDLVLLPESAPEISKMQAFTDLQEVKFPTKNLVVGRTYLTRGLKELVYLGKFPYNFKKYDSKSEKSIDAIENRHVFYEHALNNNNYPEWAFTFIKSPSSIAKELSEEVSEHYATQVDWILHDERVSSLDEERTVYEEIPLELTKNKEAVNAYIEELEKVKPIYYYNIYYFEKGLPKEFDRWYYRSWSNNNIDYTRQYYIRKQYLKNGKEKLSR